MRKRLVSTPAPASSCEAWLDLEPLAMVEISSEDITQPIEGALVPGNDRGWQAAEPGVQLVRILFNVPQRIRRVRLRFSEPVEERTQEFALRWSSDGGRSYHEIVRQQWNFSPSGATSEVEDYRVELTGVTVLELAIVPNLSGGKSKASLEEFRLA